MKTPILCITRMPRRQHKGLDFIYIGGNRTRGSSSSSQRWSRSLISAYSYCSWNKVMFPSLPFSCFKFNSPSYLIIAVTHMHLLCVTLKASNPFPPHGACWNTRAGFLRLHILLLHLQQATDRLRNGVLHFSGFRRKGTDDVKCFSLTSRGSFLFTAYQVQKRQGCAMCS